VRNGADEEREEMYEESCRRYAERRREVNRAAWASTTRTRSPV
jgi:hypothetical protein